MAVTRLSSRFTTRVSYPRRGEGVKEPRRVVDLTGMEDERPPLPPGSEHIASWARARRWIYEPYPNVEWFRAWEPFDTMVSGTTYFNSVSFTVGSRGTGTMAEPWYAPEDSTPLDRTVLGFVSHPGFTRRAAARGGEHFNTRVSFIENPPPPEVKVGDAAWDENIATFAASASEAAAAFPVAARHYLAQIQFVGHIEIRPGGMVLHYAGTLPRHDHMENLANLLPQLTQLLVHGR